jgi:hypothetical protein
VRYHHQVTLRALLPVAALLVGGVLAGCSGEDPAPASPSATVQPESDAGCAELIPDEALTALSWTPEGGAAYTVKGCRREAQQGYLEVRRRTGKVTTPTKAEKVFDDLCRVLDRTGTPTPGLDAPWIGKEVMACAVEPTKKTGLSKVVVLIKKRLVYQYGIAVLEATPQPKVRAAFRKLLLASSGKG